MTAGRAMVITSAVPGNEAINEAMVVRAGAGVSAHPDEVGAAVDAIRGDLTVMGARARRLVPTGAADAVVDLALGLAGRTSLAA
jgi:hypothetical protein